jgi:hypothetical protein
MAKKIPEQAIAPAVVVEETIEQLNARAQIERGALQEVQAAHARSLRLDQLARQDPAVADLRAELAKAQARIAELEAALAAVPVATSSES